MGGGGVKLNGGFMEFEKLLNGGRQNEREVGTKHKIKATQIGLSLVTSLNIGMSGILRSRLQ